MPRLRFWLATLSTLPVSCALAFHYDGYEKRAGSADASSTGGSVGLDGGCIPTSCLALGAECGHLPDGCGKPLDCGTCPSDKPFCGGSAPNQCGATPCKPKTCADLGAQCGDAANGCGNIINCGTCPAPETCSGAGPPANICTCLPKTCGELGADCGNIDDGCGTMLDCGKCVPPNSCGGSGTANKCGPGTCVPKTCADFGAECGPISTGCSGGSVDCGACGSGYACDQSNKCQCNDMNDPCAGMCNTSTTNSCAETVVCGQCPNFGDQCIGAQCKLGNGSFCSGDVECASDHCSKGRCCAIDCGGLCAECANPTYTTCEVALNDVNCPTAGGIGQCVSLNICACGDGAMDFGETGIDCGGPCPPCINP